jgi:hypothetical protein
MKDILNNYGKNNNNNKAKVITLVIKAVTGVLGTSLVLENNHPYITLTVLAIGAVANELTSIYNWK